MQIPNGIGLYRLELNLHDVVGQTQILILVLAMVTISLLADYYDHPKWFTINPFLTLLILGSVMRMDTQIQRLGRLLRFLEDPRELFKAADTAPSYIPVGDVFILLFVLTLTVYAEVQAWQYLKGLHALYALAYTSITITLILFAGYFAFQATQIGKAPMPSRQAVERAIPK